MKKTLSVLFALLMSCITASAQIQNGYVRSQGTSYNRTGSPLKGARVFVKGLNGSKVTAPNGTFNFNLGGGKTQFCISSVTLKGYTLLSPLAPAYNVGKAAVEIVMQSREERIQNEARISKIIEERITKSYNAKTKELQKKITTLEKALSNKIKKSDELETQIRSLKEQLKNLDDQYLKRNELIDKMVEEYVNLDYATMNNNKAELCSYIETGELEKADSLLNTIDINKEMADISTLSTDIKISELRLTKEKEILQSKIENASTYWRGKYDVALQRAQFDSAGVYIKQLVEVDTTNVNNLFTCAYFFQTQNKHEIAEIFYVLLLNQIDLKRDIDMNTRELNILAYNNMASMFMNLDKEKLAIESWIKASQLCINSANEDVYSYIRLSNTLYRTLAGICSNFPEAFESKGFKDTYTDFILTLCDVLYSDKLDNIEEINEDRMSLLQIFSLLNDDDDEQAKDKLVGLFERYYERAENDNDILEVYKMASAWGTTLSSTRDFEHAEKIFSIGNKWLQKIKKGNEIQLASNYENLAYIHSEIGMGDLSEKEYEKSLNIYRELANKNAEAYNPNVAFVLNNLAVLHSTLNKYELAEKEHLEAIKIREQLEKESPKAYGIDLALSYNNLASLYWDLIRYDDSEMIYTKMSDVYMNIDVGRLKKYRINFAWGLFRLGALKALKKKNIEAIFSFKESLKLSREIMQEKKDSILYLNDLLYLSQISSLTKDYVSSYTYNGELLKLLHDNYEKDTVRWKKDLNMAMVNQAFYSNLLGKFSEGERYSLEAIKMDTINHTAYTNLAASLLFQGYTKEAKIIYVRYKSEFKEAFLNDFAEFERLKVIPKECEADVEKIKKMLFE